jgi:hypothetical protein
MGPGCSNEKPSPPRLQYPLPHIAGDCLTMLHLAT